MEPAMKLREAGGGRQFDVELLGRDGDSVRLLIDGQEITMATEPNAGDGTILRCGETVVRVNAVRRRDSILVAAGPSAFEFVAVEGRRGRGGHGLATPEVTAPMPGKVLKVLVAEGATVAAGEPLIVLEAMKMETTLYAESGAVVKKVRAEPGAMVDHGTVLLELSPADSSKPESAARDD
jgi:acetyl-CoA/propionyl-CoA carboxylase biotin carboxyl carrier protein